MKRVRFTGRAEADLGEIFTFIARDNAQAASRWVAELRGRMGLLSEFPDAGRRRPEVGPPVRALPFDSYTVYYRADDREVVILRVLHASRDHQRHL